MKRARPFITNLILLGLLLFPGCITIVTAPASTPQTSAQDPLVGTWEMTRTSISPQIPAPNIVIGQVIPEKTTWQITRVNGVLKINYDGKDTWYNALGINITRKPVVVNEISKMSSTFLSGGSFYMEKLPVVINALLPPGTIEQLSVNFDDNVQVSFPSTDVLAAIITINGQGRYYGGGAWKTFNQSGTVTYQGIRK